jgi:hypothetical protein
MKHPYALKAHSRALGYFGNEIAMGDDGLLKVSDVLRFERCAGTQSERAEVQTSRIWS